MVWSGKMVSIAFFGVSEWSVFLFLFLLFVVVCLFFILIKIRLAGPGDLFFSGFVFLPFANPPLAFQYPIFILFPLSEFSSIMPCVYNAYVLSHTRGQDQHSPFTPFAPIIQNRATICQSITNNNCPWEYASASKLKTGPSWAPARTYFGLDWFV